jgi:hypothetical protein
MAEWSLKTNDDGHAIVEDGLVVYVDKEGKERAFDPGKMHEGILKSGREAQSWREKAEQLEGKLGVLDEIDGEPKEWVEKAREALKTVENLEDKDLVDAQKVEQLKEELTKTSAAKEAKLRKQLADAGRDAEEKLRKKEQQIRNLMVKNAFSSSSYFTGSDPKTNVRPEMAEAFFGKNFRVEEVNGDLSLVGYDAGGNQILSQESMGEIAAFDEALGIIIDKYPGKETILTANGAAGTGSAGGTGPRREPQTTRDLKALKERHKKALADGQLQTAVALKNQIWQLEQSLKPK